jgi:hypothetical protein
MAFTPKGARQNEIMPDIAELAGSTPALGEHDLATFE